MYRILLADSDAEVRRGLKQNMEETGWFQADEAADGKTALARLRNGRYDVVIADTYLPNGSGLELLESLREEAFAPIGILMGTGETFDDVRMAMRCGAVDYLVKPLSQKDVIWLKGRLTELVERRRRRLAREQRKEELLEKARVLLRERFPETEEAISRAAGQEGAKEPWEKSSFYIEKARKMIAQRVHAGEGEVSVKALACELGLSCNYFGKIFREGTGMSLSDYVNDLRLRRAAELLRTTELKICEVGRAAGYENQHYFSIAFKRAAGVSPSEFRTLLQ